MCARAHLGQLELRAASNDLATMLDEDGQRPLQAEQAWLQAAGLVGDEGQRLHAERALQRCVFVQAIEHPVGLCAAPQFDHHAHAAPVALVANVADLFDAAVAH